MLSKEDVLKIFEETGGILKGHFKLTSGRHSDTYMQCAKLFVDTNKSRLLCKELADKIRANNIKVDYVVSPAVGGIIMGYEMASQLNVPNVFFERQEGQMTLRRGFRIPEGSNVLVVEDVVTTGGSVKEVIEEVRKAGSTPVAVASIVDRSNGKVSFGIDFVNLISMDVVSYEESECPLCKEGLVVVKPGSRNLK